MDQIVAKDESLHANPGSQEDHKKLMEAEKIIKSNTDTIKSNSQLISELKSEIDELKRITKKLAQGSSSKNKTASLQ